MSRFIAAFSVLFVVSALLSCTPAMHAGPSPAIPGAAPGRAAHPHDIIEDGGGNITATGPVSNVHTGGFTLNEGSGGGYVHVTTSGSTKIAGPAPFNGENVAVTGSGTPGSDIAATSVAQQVVLPSGVLALTGPVSDASAGRFTVDAPGYGHTHVTTNAQTQFENGSPANGDYAQAVGPGTESEVASYVASWSGAPPPIVTSGTIAAVTTLGFTLDAGGSNGAVPVILGSSTAVSTWPMVVGGTATVTGAGSLAFGVVASKVSVPTPAPTATPVPTPTPPTIVLVSGGVTGEDNAFSPPDGDSSSGGTGGTVDGIPCAPVMITNEYHVHWYLGLLVNGVQLAVPDQIGLVDPGPIENGFTSTAGCYYDIHTHDASGMVHVEAANTSPLSSSLYTVGNFLDVWGVSVGANNVGPYNGPVRVFVATVPLKQTFVDSYSEYAGNPANIPIYSHEAVWLEVGPTFVVPPKLPAVEFYTEY